MKVGQNIEVGNANWSFGGNVPDTFVEHIRQSVPLYEEGHEIVCYLSDFFCMNGGTCYEVGVSTGELLRKLVIHNRHKPDIRWTGMDCEAAMIKKAKEHCGDLDNVEILNEDARLFEFEPCDLIVSYYCMQFIPPRDRQSLFNKFYQSLNWGGALVLFEKVRGPDARFQDILTSLYNDFKIRQGFSAEEIVSKTASLKGILEPFSTAGNMGLLARAGFVDVMTVMKYLGFEGYLAIK
jgi:tRNA (cmo5U34)-methyltransferase